MPRITNISLKVPSLREQLTQPPEQVPIFPRDRLCMHSLLLYTRTTALTYEYLLQMYNDTSVEFGLATVMRANNVISVRVATLVMGDSFVCIVKSFSLIISRNIRNCKGHTEYSANIFDLSNRNTP
jgi:hypothetical protein